MAGVKALWLKAWIFGHQDNFEAEDTRFIISYPYLTVKH